MMIQILMIMMEIQVTQIIIIVQRVTRFGMHLMIIWEKKILQSHIQESAAQSSHREDKAMAVEREVNDLRRAQFMAGKVGKTYTGTIISVTAFGFFVELAEVFVEGLVRVSSLTDDYYIYIEPEHKWIGQRRHRTFKIGDRVKVRVADVNIALRRINLDWLKTL